MKKGIGFYIGEIIFILVFLCFTYYMVNNCAYSKIDKKFVEDNNIAVNIVNNNSKVLEPMSDLYAKNNLDNTVINVVNYNSNNIEYKLFMRIKKDNKLDFSELKIKVDDDIFRLNSKYDYEDDDYLYFDLAHKKINNENNVNFAMWLDEDVKDYNNYKFSYNFYVESI